jgi:hypothetical protein
MPDSVSDNLDAITDISGELDSGVEFRVADGDIHSDEAGDLPSEELFSGESRDDVSLDVEDATPYLAPWLEQLAKEYPGMVQALGDLPGLSDGISPEEEASLARLEKVFFALEEEERYRLAPVLAHRKAVKRVSDAGMVADGDLSDWPSETVVVVADRLGDVEGADFIDLAEVRVLLGEEALWVGGTLVQDCVPDVAVMVLLDMEEGLHYDVELLGYRYLTFHNTSFKHLKNDAEFVNLNQAGTQWICQGKGIEVRIPWSSLSGIPSKENPGVWLMTYDMTSPADAKRFDLSANIVLPFKDYRGAVWELFALVDSVLDAVDDPGTTVALALQNRHWADVVAPEVLNTVHGDAVALLRYALDLPVWQQMYGIPARFDELPLEAKMMWAWRGQQNLLFGTFATYLEWGRLSMERYRFNSITAEDLAYYRQEFLNVVPSWEDLRHLVGQVDTWLWTRMWYSAIPEMMEFWCSNQWLSDHVCLLWRKDKEEENFTLGNVDGRDIPNWDAPSASFQRALEEDLGYYKGDCRTHCVVASAFYLSVGIPATGWMYYPHDDSVQRAVHDLPLYFDGDLDRWMSFQSPDHIEPKDAVAHIWMFLPPRDPMLFGRYNVDHDKVSLFDGAVGHVGATFGDMIDHLKEGIARTVFHEQFWADYPGNHVVW